MASHRAGSDIEGLFCGADELIGLVSTRNLSRTGETGYALVFTKGRVIGSRRPESEAEFVVYLGPGSAVTEDGRARAFAVGSRLLKTSQFVLSKGSVAEIIYRHPGFLTGGFVVFKTSTRAFKVEIPVVSGWNGDPLYTSKVLLESLVSFSPERLYDGGTGELYIEGALKRGSGAGRPAPQAPGQLLSR